MPSIAAQSPRVVPASNGVAPPGLPGVTSARAVKRGRMKVMLYGRGRVGKSTLTGCWPKKLLAVGCEPRDNGGADSLIGTEGVDITVVHRNPVGWDEARGVWCDNPAGGVVEQYAGTEKLAYIAQWLTAEFSSGRRPYETVTVDVTALQDIVLAEVMGWSSVDEIIKRPTKTTAGGEGVGFKKFMERADRMIKALRPFVALPCDTIFVAQEKDHNPKRDEDGNPVEGKLIRSAQEKSFMSAALGQGITEWLQNATNYHLQLYMDAEVTKTTTYVDVAGVSTPQDIYAATGKFVRRLRCSYHPNYQAGITAPGVGAAPEYIEAATPQEMYAALVEVAEGRRTDKGKY